MARPIPIPLGLQSYDRPTGLQPEVRLLNLYIEKDTSGAAIGGDEFFRLQRPGLASFASFDAPVRGMFFETGVGNSLPYAVAGDTLYEIDGEGATSVGTVPDDGDTVPIAASNFGIGLASDGDFLFYDYETLQIIDLPDDAGLYGALVSVETINSYFILGLSSGRFYWMLPGATEINALDYASAESRRDNLVSIHRLNDELFMFGTSTVEVWQPNATDPNSIFQKAPGRAFDRGCASRDTIQNFDNSLVWVGEDDIVYRVGSTPQRISTEGIEERLRNRSDLPSAFTFAQDGHRFYVLKIPGQGSFAYDAQTEAWSEFGSYGETVWKPHLAVSLGSTTLVGDETSGTVWRLDPDRSNDDGTILERVVSGSVSFAGRPIRKDSFAMNVGVEADCDLRLRWHDGRDPLPDAYQTLPARSPVDIVQLFRLGQSSQPVTTFEVSCIADTKIRLSGAALNGSWA